MHLCHVHLDVNGRMFSKLKGPIASAIAVLLSAGVLVAAFAPIGQFYVAWVALCPLLIIVSRARTIRAAVLWGWLAGITFFGLSIWWLWTATLIGTIVLVIYFGFYWGIAAGIIRMLRLLPSSQQGETFVMPSTMQLLSAAFLVPSVWVACEWLRCNVASGFPWMPLGNSQSPILLMCQVADLGGPWIVSYWIVLLNTMAAMGWLYGTRHRSFAIGAATAVGILLVVAFYGMWRIHSTPTLPGLRATAIQSNSPHLRGGVRTVSEEDGAKFLLELTEKAMSAEATDLVVLPEAGFPPINEEARNELQRAPVGAFLERAYQTLRELATDHEATLVVGGNAVIDWQTESGARVGTNICNSAYVIPPDSYAPALRYDKVCLVPFSERIPFREGPLWLHRLALLIAADRASQPLHSGTPDQTSVFRIEPNAGQNDSQPEAEEVRFITPICLENIDPAVLAGMLRSGTGTGKRADLIVNLSNDGWFASQQRHQHLQSMSFRCIENRVPMVRASNTGISAFIDSTGKVYEEIPANTAGFATAAVLLDDRVACYTRIGDLFPVLCIGVSISAAAFRSLSVVLRKKGHDNRRLPA